MIHTQTVTIAGKDTLLLIVTPDWAGSMRATIAFATDVSETVTGLQERRADQFAPRLGLQYRASLLDTDLQTLRVVLATLQGKPVAIPFWPDVQATFIESGVEKTDWNARMLHGQVNVGWDAGFANVIITTGGTAPDRQMRGALLVGRLGRSTLKAVTHTLADVDIAFVEDSPWECLAEPAAADPGVWSEAWKINWLREPEQSERVLVEHRALGRGREAVADGTTDAHYWQQAALLTLDRDQVAGLLAFHVARRGSVEAFTLPSALQPGTATPAAPHVFDASNGRVRFTERELRIDFATPLIADVQVQVEQQIESEIFAQEPPSYAYLYRLDYAGAVLTLTDWESPIAALSATWTPARIKHGRIRQSLKPQNEECELTVWLDDAPLIAPLLRMETEAPLLVTIHEMELPNGTPQMLFTGSAWKGRGRGKEVKITAAAFGGALGRKLPRFQFSTTCNHTLFSHGCSRRRPANMTAPLWQSSGVFSDQWPDPKVLLTGVAFAAPIAPNPPVHFFAGGWLETGSGSTRQVREITGSWFENGVLSLSITRPLRADLIAPAQTVIFWPGCDGQYSTCGARYANTVAFGGFPFMPAWIEQAPSSIPTAGK